VAHLFRFAFVISLRSAGPSSGLRSSKAHRRSSDTLQEGVSGWIMGLCESGQTSCMHHNYRTLRRHVR
jgi:hypothetical protein